MTGIPRSIAFLKYQLRPTLAQMTVIVGLVVFCMIYAHECRGQSQTAVLPQFEVASIKPSKLIAAVDDSESIEVSPGGRLTLGNIRLSSCLKWAYGVQDPQISGPGDLDFKRYDVIAQASGPTAEDQLKLMLRSLLADRFKLAFHYEEKALIEYVLVVAKNGPKFRQAEGDGKGNVKRTQVGVTAERISMQEFADLLSGQLRSPVADKTGLKGTFDLAFDLRQYMANENTPVSISSLILQAMEDQLGLKLQSARGPAQVIVIDHLEKPSAN
jgi:uncharacterized protein (TIGR03435 family)